MVATPFRGPKRLADLVRPALEPMLAKRGLAQASLVMDWPVIVGARTAGLCEPARLQWPPRGPKSDPKASGAPATLWLRVMPGRALDVQYGAAALIDRINAHFGWRMIAKVAVAPQPKRPVMAPVVRAPIDPALVDRAARIVAGADHAPLRAALTTLGAEILRERAN